MKLNEKALKKIQDEMDYGEYQIPCGYENVEGMSIYHLEEHEFEPDDFQGMVCLTIDQAKALLRRVPMFQMSADWMHPIEVLKAKIEQAEMSKQST